MTHSKVCVVYWAV